MPARCPPAGSAIEQMFQLLKPAIQVFALASNCFEPKVRNRGDAEKRLFVLRHGRSDSPRRWREAVHFLRRLEVLLHRFCQPAELVLAVRIVLRQAKNIRKNQRFELMKLQMRYEPPVLDILG